MSQEREPLPVIDFVSVLIGPVLVMMMVGSLVFFLIEVAYAGLYEDRLLYTFFFFVVASVLIARIHIRMGRNKAALYSAGLGIACFVAMQAQASYPGAWMSALAPVINIMLMVFVWWSANKLTWDCTHLEESRKSSGKGILAAAGMDHSVNDPDRSEQWQERERKKKKGKRDPGKLVSWWERYQAYLDWKQKRPHTPGVWILYFALAAIPIFGLGQSLIPASDNERRRETFIYAAVYVGSAMGLLVTTTLLGLQRYLRDRGATISTKLTVGWLGTGAVIVLIFLGCGAMLPRPHAETSLVKSLRGNDNKRDASQNAVVKDKSSGEGEGKEGKGEQSEEKGKDGKPKSGGDEPDDNGSGGKKKGKDGNKDDKNGDSKQSDSNLSQVAKTIASFFKWLIWIALALLVIGFLCFGGLKWLAPFTSWAQGLLDWWKSLFEKKMKSRPTVAKVEEPIKVEIDTRPGFEFFNNPFTNGEVKRRSNAELVRYTFAALEAWARDHAHGRSDDETAIEFARRLGEEFPNVSDGSQAVSGLVTHLLFSTGDLPADTTHKLAQTWEQLERSR